MQIQQSQNQQSFGMAWKVRADTLTNAKPEELQSLKEFFKGNSEALDTATENFDTFIGAKVNNKGNIIGLIIESFLKPKNREEAKFMIKNQRRDNILYNITLHKYTPKNAGEMKIKDITDSKFIAKIKDTIKGADERFGTYRRNKAEEAQVNNFLDKK